MQDETASSASKRQRKGQQIESKPEESLPAHSKAARPVPEPEAAEPERVKRRKCQKSPAVPEPESSKRVSESLPDSECVAGKAKKTKKPSQKKQKLPEEKPATKEPEESHEPRESYEPKESFAAPTNAKKHNLKTHDFRGPAFDRRWRLGFTKIFCF